MWRVLVSGRISIRALLAEGDFAIFVYFGAFNISIRALLAEGDEIRDGRYQSARISIRALLAEGDEYVLLAPETGEDFNPRPPCGGRLGQGARRRAYEHFNPRPPCGGRRLVPFILRSWARFQSAPSLRRATCARRQQLALRTDFNPRPPCGGRQPQWTSHMDNYEFQSAPSLRRATDVMYATFEIDPISIRALLAEGDSST